LENTEGVSAHESNQASREHDSDVCVKNGNWYIKSNKLETCVPKEALIDYLKLKVKELEFASEKH